MNAAVFYEALVLNLVVSLDVSDSGAGSDDCQAENPGS
jgi:hypothetical protein